MSENRNLLLDPSRMPEIANFIRRMRGQQDMKIYAWDDIGYYDENGMYLRWRQGTMSVCGDVRPV